MRKNQLDTSDITNELKSGSVFFKKNANEKPARTENRSEIRPEIRTEKRTVLIPIKRRTKRYSFEFYEDQLSRIKKIKIETELDGENISQSEIVREALDYYFESVRKSERSEERTEIRTEKRPA
jgi:hypothetical protein